MDRTIDQDECMRLAQPLLPALYGVLEEARKLYFGVDYSDRARADHSERGMANVIYDHAEKEMLKRCTDWSGAHPINIRGLKVLNYKDQLVFRLKKVSGLGRHRNAQTSQQMAYDGQEPFKELPPSARRLTVGYQLNAMGNGFERIMIARPLGRTIFWTSQIAIVDADVIWADITPKRIVGTDVVDFDAARARRKR